MRSICLVTIVLAGAVSASGQGTSGIEFGAGIDATGSSNKFSASYFHPIPLKQLYAVAGLSTFHSPGRSIAESVQPSSAVIPWMGAPPSQTFKDHRSIFLGIQAGDHFYALPRISYNFYGNSSSPGWGFTGGLLLHPGRLIAFGFNFTFEHVRFDERVDHLGPARTTTMEAVLRVKFPE